MQRPVQRICSWPLILATVTNYLCFHAVNLVPSFGSSLIVDCYDNPGRECDHGATDESNGHVVALARNYVLLDCFWRLGGYFSGE